MSQDTLRKIYFSYFHSILLCGIIFWGNSAYSSNIFKIQKRIIIVIMNARNRDCCHQLFKKLKILPLKSQYIFLILLFIAKNRNLCKLYLFNYLFIVYLLFIIQDLYKSNLEIHNMNTSFISDLHTPTANLTTFQRGPFYLGIKVFSYLPTSVKNTSHDTRQFKSILKSFLPVNSFYSVQEYFTWNANRDLGLV